MSTISAGLSNTTALVQTGDATGNLVFQTNGTTTALTLDTNQNANFPANVTVVGTLIANIAGNGSTITNINASNITSGTISNAYTTANSANGASTIVARDANGNFTANVVSATDVNSTNVTATTGSFTNISGNGATLTAINASSISSGTIGNAYTTGNTANSASTLVLRDSNGAFSAGAITADSVSGNAAALTGINASNISSGTISNARTTADSANGASTIVARDSNGSFTANAGTFSSLSSNTISLVAGTITTNASNSTDIVNKAYVDSVAEGLRAKPSARAATTANLTADYDNGTSGVGATLTATTNVAFPTIDGVSSWAITTPPQGVLVKNQTNPAYNGRYNLTDLGEDGVSPWVLTRCSLCDTSAEIPGSYVFVTDGDVNADTGWTMTVADPATFVIGTDAIIVVQFSGAGTYTAGTGLSLANNTFSISNTAVTAATYGNAGAVATFTVNAQGQLTAASNAAINASSITLGTLSATYGGTGAANLTADNVILGNGASTVKVVAPGTANNVLTSNGTTWISQAPAAGGVSSITGTANQIIASASTGAVTLSTPQSINTASSVQFGSFGVGTAASGTSGEIRATNNVTAYYSSDKKFKENVRQIDNATSKAIEIGGKYFDWTDEYIKNKGGADGYFVRKSDIGVIAQDVQKVLPDAVREREDGTLAVDYQKLVSLAFAAIAELKTEIDVLKAR